MFGQLKMIILFGCAAALAVGIISNEMTDPSSPRAGAERPVIRSATPPKADTNTAYANEVRIARAADGHFWVDADISGVSLPFLVDTGASSVVLSPADAEKLGLYLSADDFTLTYATANGEVRAAPVLLPSLRVGPLEVTNVEATVNGAPLRQSLLGMSFLGRLDGFEYRGNDLVMRR